MELIEQLGLGLATALTAANLGYCFLGALLGTLIGVLPGIGPTATIAMLLPLTYALPPVSALIMLSGIYYGAQYGGSTTAILINLPGEAPSAVTAIDGYRMARTGRAGAALAIAAIGSFVAGTIATAVIVVFAEPLTTLALKFSSPEYAALIVLGLVLSVTLANGPVLHAVAMIVLGLLLGLVGTDKATSAQRFTMGHLDLADGLNIVAVAIGIFGIAEILRNLEHEMPRGVAPGEIGRLRLTREEWRASRAPILRGTAIGSLLGILPGGGALLGAFASYAIEKKMAADPSRFGQGAIEGVAGPESANNAGAQTSFIPMLTLGIPANAVMALMVGAMIIHGIVPGPNLVTQKPDLFWGLVTSMWIGNAMLLILNLPLVGLWVRLLTVPYALLFPAIVLFSAIGVFGIESSPADVLTLIAFGLLGYLLTRLGCEPTPLLMGFVLGPMLEEHVRRAMLVSRGDASVFFTRPISATLLALALFALILVVLPAIARQRQHIFNDD